MEIVIGLLIIAVGAFCQSSSYVPINKVKSWSWESFWLVQGLFAWLVFPIAGALLAVPAGHSISELFVQGNMFNVGMTVLFGMLWGIGGLTFGLSMRYLGVALGQSVSLGTCAGMGTILGPVMLHIFYPVSGSRSSHQAYRLRHRRRDRHIGRNRHHRHCRTHEVLIAFRRGKESCGQGLQFPERHSDSAARRSDERLFQCRSGIRQQPLLRRDSGNLQDPACDNAGDLRRFPDELRILPFPEFQEQFLEGLCQCQSPRRQCAVLRIGRNPVVQPVLRTQSRKRILERVTGSDYICILYIDGAQCHFLERLGHHSQRMERLLEEDCCCACGRNLRTHFIDVPA